VAVAAPLLAEHAPPDVRDQWLPMIAAGQAIVTTTFGGDCLAPFADHADLVLAQQGDALVAVPGDAVHARREHSVDGARRLFSVVCCVNDVVELASGAEARDAHERAFDRGALATAAQLLGLADQMLAITVEYVKERQQFGVPIGSFQAVKHRLADALLQIEFARPVVHRAAHSAAHGSPDRSRDVSMAKAYASDAADFTTRQALQCHGAIGYTVEHDLHLYMKRTWALRNAYGDARWHRRRVADLVLGPRP
jgi:alkylation response protein AidB-like acyl-CoA dehydrogenase